MLFSLQGSTDAPMTVAISQPAHALISGQILRDWAEPLHPETVLAAEQHDVAWLDWEVAPTFDQRTGLPHLFRDIGAALHAPMWVRGVDHALAAWGRRAALLISRHGNTIYERFSDRHRSVDDAARTADEDAARDYLRQHRALQHTWAQALGLDVDTVEREVDLLAFADTLSLVLCRAIPVPPQIKVAGRELALTSLSDTPDTYGLDPWPFASAEVTFETEARALPPSGRFDDEAAMRAWLADPSRVVVRSCLHALA